MDRQKIERGPVPAFCQKWEEVERGWGERPDGFSLHISLEGLKRYVQAYWDGMPDQAPEEYERPCGTPYEVSITDELSRQIQEAGNGLRFWQHHYEYPGNGGTDGWIPLPNGGHGKNPFDINQYLA